MHECSSSRIPVSEYRDRDGINSAPTGRDKEQAAARRGKKGNPYKAVPRSASQGAQRKAKMMARSKYSGEVHHAAPREVGKSKPYQAVDMWAGSRVR
mmetsp:Transcript_32364/g.70829  ORF Transcript_32364/g.70829 Transcript_32364/m.70829 type:complete len:97 (-) Transcript_32364:109-399(-)